MMPNSLAANVIVSAPNATIQIGQTFDIHINIDPLKMPVSGAQLSIKYNQSVLKVNKVLEGNFFKQEGAKTYFQGGVLNNSTGIASNIFSVILGPSNVSRSGTFLIINATAIGSSNISWINLSDVKISDPKGISVSLKSINRTLNISKMNEMNIPASGITIGEAIENTDLIWSTGGNAQWSGQADSYFYGGNAAKSGSILDYQNSWLRTTVIGPGNVSFFWKVSSEAKYDYLRFYIDGVRQSQISGTVGWQKKLFNTGVGTHTLQWKYIKDLSVSSGSDTGWVDKVEFDQPVPPDNTSFTLKTGGSTRIMGEIGNLTEIYINGTVRSKGTVISGALVTTNDSVPITTDASGFYSIRIPAGIHNIIATRDPVFYPNSSIIVLATSGSTVMHDIELKIKPLGTISGSVIRNIND